MPEPAEMPETFTDERRAEAIALIRRLSVFAGNERAVVDVLARHASQVGPERAAWACVAALAVTFSSCITTPVSLDDRNPVPVQIPSADTTTTRSNP